MEQTLHDRMRERAYHLWKSGDGQGDDNHYWLIAEREVLAEVAADRTIGAVQIAEDSRPTQSARPDQVFVEGRE